MYTVFTYPHHKNSWSESFVAMRLILISNLLIVCAYNIDTKYPMIYPDSASNANQYAHAQFNRSYFGYSVLLHRDLQKNASWLFIGAPRGNYTRPSRKQLLSINEPGVVYRCNLPGICVEIEPEVTTDTHVFGSGYLRKNYSWFGGAMSLERKNDYLTVCAPRTLLTNSPRKASNTLQGVCYSDRTFSTTLKEENLFSFQNTRNPLYGFSVTFVSQGDTRSRIVGSPNDGYGSITIANFSKSGFVNFPNSLRQTLSKFWPRDQDHLHMFGYAVTTGYYFDRNKLLFACSDPGWNYVGQVYIIHKNTNTHLLIDYLTGSDIGESFGIDLATGDLNKDGLDDLVVGAPFWGNDNGRVHIYLGQPQKKFEAVVILEGAMEDAQFGYTVASGDLDRDGFSDVIVGAPWEGSGVIYVYNGDASLKDKVRPAVSQRIAMQSSSLLPAKGINIRTFGFSISEPIDIDDNGYADIAVGAYKSGHVIVLRSRPVVRTSLTVSTIPSTLQRNDSTFLLKACVEYRGYITENIHPFTISFIIDKTYNRAKTTSLELVSTNPPHKCMNVTVTLVTNIQDFIEPLTIYASHTFTHNVLSPKFCKTCPVESRDGKSNSVQTLLPFDINCGEDRVCNSNIIAKVKFSGVRENNSWMIGSNDITLETHLENRDEPAYLTTVLFTFPNGIVLRSILPSCEEDPNGDTLIVICKVGNPLKTDEQKSVKLDLDMKYLTDGSLHGKSLEFSVEIRTHSVNRGTSTLQLPLTLLNEASLSLNGTAIEEMYYLPYLYNDQLNITFQHNYQIFKFGETPIEEAELIVNIPTAVNDSGSFVYLYTPRIYISGEYYDCLSDGVNLVDQQNKFHRVALSSNMYNPNNETPKNIPHGISKGDIIDDIDMTSRIMERLYYARIKTEGRSIVGNLTSRENNTIYLNCSTYGVNCSIVYCNFKAKSQQHIGELVMRVVLNGTKFTDTFGLSEEAKVIKFSTNAYVQIIQPANRISLVDIKRDANLTTEFYSTAKAEKLQLWVVLVSVSLGLILLFIIIIILSTVGFFKRRTKEELSALKSNKMTENERVPEIADELD